MKIVKRVAQLQIQNIAVFRRELERKYTEENMLPDGSVRPLKEKADELWRQLMRSTEKDDHTDSSKESEDVGGVLVSTDIPSTCEDNMDDNVYEVS